MNELSLFSGYGGFSLGLKLAGVDVRTVCYVEIDKYCQAVLEARIADGILDRGPIHDDIKTFDAGAWQGHIDILTAGFPCPAFSTAGLRKVAQGLEDENNLWPETLSVVKRIHPRIVFLENTAGILSGNRGQGVPSYAAAVVGQLADEGYRVRWEVLGASDLGAPHQRDRWWVIGVADSNSQRGRSWNAGRQYAEDAWQSSTDPDTGKAVIPKWPPRPYAIDEWQRVIEHRPDLSPGLTSNALANVLRMADGSTDRVHKSNKHNRLRIIGNGIIPEVAAAAWHLMMEPDVG